jgi:hypothetical protein
MIVENINKIDYDLKQLFESVEITEKSDRGNYLFEINATHDNTKVKVEISKPDLNQKVVKWTYYTNPLNESSDKIERFSSIGKIATDIFDIISKKMMDKSYLESISYESINESVITESSVISEDEKIELEKKLEEIMKRFEIEERLLNESKYDENVLVKTISFKQNLKPTDLYLLDFNLKTAGFSKITYQGDVVTVQFYD